MGGVGGRESTKTNLRTADGDKGGFVANLLRTARPSVALHYVRHEPPKRDKGWEEDEEEDDQE